MHRNDLALTAHLMRRAGFGATREELEDLASRPYEDLVEDLVHPERLPEVDADIVQRYYVGEGVYVGTWMYRMVVTKRPLEEKMALFWHHVFATASLDPQKLLRRPTSVKVDDQGRMFIADNGSYRVQVYQKEAIHLTPQQMSVPRRSATLNQE